MFYLSISLRGEIRNERYLYFTCTFVFLPAWRQNSVAVYVCLSAVGVRRASLHWHCIQVVVQLAGYVGHSVTLGLVANTEKKKK